MQERTRMGFIIREDNYPNCLLQKDNKWPWRGLICIFPGKKAISQEEIH